MHIPGYQIERELGQGGMAIVYLALQESLHRNVALKVIKPILTTDEEFAQRFLREGRLIAQLSDPHIVTVYDIASHEGTYYLSMEYLPGGTLQQRIRNGLWLTEALSIARAIAGALHYAHRRGIIHRDIKPQNILFRENGQPVLSDFGIAKTMGASTIMTRTGLSLGTPRYMSPEQIRGQEMDTRADIYSLGVLFYEMLIGHVPYMAEDSFALAMMHVTSPVPEMPPHLSRFQPLLNKLLEKDPNQRFQNGQEVIAAIDAFEAGDFNLLSVTSSAPPPAVTPDTRSSRRFGWKTGVPAAILAGAALAGGSWYLYRLNSPTTQPPAITTPTAPAPSEASTVALTPVAPAPQTPGVNVDAQEAQPTQQPAAESAQDQIQEPAQDRAQEEQRWARLQAEQFFEQAQRARKDGALQVSLVYIEQGLQAIPNHPDLLNLKQEVLEQQANLQRQEETTRQQAEATERQKAETAEREKTETAEREKAQTAERLDRADKQLAQALDEQRKRAYEASLLHIEQGLQQVPDHQQLLTLRQEVRNQLRETQATPATQPTADDNVKIAGLLRECAAHLQANRLTVGQGGNAADCYDEVLKLDRGNTEALAGLDRISDRYAKLVTAAIRERNTQRAKSLLSRMESLDPNYSQLPRLRQQLALAEAPKPVATPPSKPETPPVASESQTPAVPAIDLVSIPSKPQPPATTPETQVIVQDQHTRVAKTENNDNVSLQVTTSPQGLLDEASRAAVEKQVPPGTPAKLRIRSDVEDAEIWINNRSMGATPMEIEMPPGSYQVRVSREGYLDWNGKVDLAPGDESSISTVLARKPEVAAAMPPPAPASTPKPAPPAAEPEPPPREPEPQVALIGRQAPGCLSGNCENGRGVFRYPDGSEYSGYFRNATIHGQGTYTYAKRGEKYIGEWRNGVINGQGTYYYRSGNRYDGQWRNGLKSGQGVYLYANRGERYEGQFANDQPNGRGTYYYSNGDRYEGEWRNGRKHGQGVLYEGDQKIVGEWRNDQKVRVRIEQ